MSWKGCGRRRSWPNYLRICWKDWEEPRKS